MVAEVNGHKRHASLHEPPREQRFLRPLVFAVGVDNLLRFAGDVPRGFCFLAKDQIISALVECIERGHIAVLIEVALNGFHLARQRTAFAQALQRKARGQLQQPIHLIAHKGIVLFA